VTAISARPAIGLCTALERARWSVWDQEAVLLPRNYIDAVQAAGGLALLVPPDASLVDAPDELLDRLDGLILAGGSDLDPANYGASAHSETVGCVPERDRFEIALLQTALARDLPVLAICRGMQVMNVAHGGTLHQHLPESHGHHEHRRVSGSFDGADHDVVLDDGSLAARIVGERVHATKSHHHQGVDRLGEGLLVTGRSEFDSLPEAIELPDRRFALGVQWHPEADEASPFIAALVAEAARARGGVPGAVAGDGRVA